MMATKPTKESGLVSILAVIMFMIFISIIVVGFIKIMSDEQRQATDNDLSASALTAAQSGVEDAKRVILLCLAGDPLYGDINSGQCRDALHSGTSADPCSPFRGSARGLFQSMNITYNAANEAQVGDPQFNQYYTCLSINANPTSIVKTLSEGKSEIIPISVNGPFTSLKLNWSADTGTYGNRTASTNNDFPARGLWTDLAGNQRPPVIRAQVIPYTPGAINLDAVEQASDTFFFVPATSGTTPTVALSSDARGTPGNVRGGVPPLRYTTCTTTPPGYSCNMQIDGLTGAPSPVKYYLRLTMLYGNSTAISVTPFDGAAGSDRTFDGGQFVVDVTGRTNDVYRRVQARVSPVTAAIFPEYAVDTSGLLCKDITVADATYTSYCP